MKTPFALALAFFLAVPSFAQAPAKPGLVTVAIDTSIGTIEVQLDPVHAPGTVANFLRYVDARMYDGGRFHRAVRMDNQVRSDVKIEVVQGGRDPEKARTLKNFDPIVLERTSVTTLKHTDGAISMARGTADSATGDFFFCIGAQPTLDFGGPRNADGQGFAAFGYVTKGMDLVRKIQAGQTNDKEQLLAPIAITRIYRK